MKRTPVFVLIAVFVASFLHASSEPARGRNGMVACQKMLASEAVLEIGSSISR